MVPYVLYSNGTLCYVQAILKSSLLLLLTKIIAEHVGRGQQAHKFAVSCVPKRTD